MSKRESLARHNLIINKLRKRPATLAQIMDYLSIESEIQGYHFVTSSRTFLRDREDIRSLYNIDILYDFSKKVYYIDFEDESIINERILEAFHTFNALNLNERLSNYIHFEKRKPQGTEHLYGLLHAIKNGLQIKFTYQKYWEDKSVVRRVEPLALKEFKNRWYLLAKDTYDGRIKSYGLDRLSELEITKKKFESSISFDVNEHYKYCFGIISPNSTTPQEVVLSFTPVQGKYIKSLPLHQTQQIIIDNSKELRIKLKLYINQDFISELLSFGHNVKVLQPQSLISQLKDTLNDTLEKYQ